MDLMLVEESVIERVALICGPHSAAGRALKERATRRAAGEQVFLWRHGRDLIVGPLPPPPKTGEGT